MRELTHLKILAYNHVHKIKSKFKSLARYILSRYIFKWNNTWACTKNSGTFCNGVIVLVSVHQFSLFFNSFVIKTYLSESRKQGIATIEQCILIFSSNVN